VPLCRDRVKRLITQLSARVGGNEALARRLGVSVETLDAWREGRSEPPLKNLLHIIEMMLDKPPREATHN
jgi:DNA-binding transcriptional regulator YiaG